jgi:hypothetical protein
MFRILIASLLISAAFPAFAIYKCESGDKTAYSDKPCATGKSSDMGDQLNDKSSAAAVTKAKEQHAQDAEKVKQLENARHKREAKEEKAHQQAIKAVIVKKKKCAALEQKKKSSNEEVTTSTGKKLEISKRKARQIEDKIQRECKV